MSSTSDNYVVLKKGDSPDPAKGVLFSNAVPDILSKWDTDADLVLYSCKDGSTLSYDERVALRSAYAATLVSSGDLHKLEIWDGVGTRQPILNIEKDLETLQTTKKGGLYYEPKGVWILQPKSENPDYDTDLEALKSTITESLRLVPPTEELEKGRRIPRPYTSPYPTEVVESDMELLPGLSSAKMLEATVDFATNAHPILRFGVGAIAGVVAYKAMGLKGVVGLVLLTMALKRVMTMGSKVIQNQRLDLVARTVQDGIPVNKEGTIDPEVLEALLKYPARDHEISKRNIDPAIMLKQWDTNPIHIDANIPVREYTDNVRQVVDGDTFYGESGAHYRLAGIDTPELHLETGAQAGAQRAWDRVRELIPDGSKVRIEVIGNQPAAHGRLPVYVYATDNAGKEFCLNQKLLEEGLARVTNFHPYHPKMEAFVHANLEAIVHKEGLWNKRYNPVVAPKPNLLSLHQQTKTNPDGSNTHAFSMG